MADAAETSPQHRAHTSTAGAAGPSDSGLESGRGAGSEVDAVASAREAKVVVRDTWVEEAAAAGAFGDDGAAMAEANAPGSVVLGQVGVWQLRKGDMGTLWLNTVQLGRAQPSTHTHTHTTH